MTDDASMRFESLYRQHFRAVLGYTLARLEPESAKDAAAETFLIAWRRLPDVPDDPLPWLLGVARKVIATQCRSHSRRDALRQRLVCSEAGQAVPGEIEEGVAERALVLAALARISENDREALRLIAWDGLSSKAAADVLGVTRLAFGVRLHRARRRFSAALAAETARAGDPPRAPIPPLAPSLPGGPLPSGRSTPAAGPARRAS